MTGIFREERPNTRRHSNSMLMMPRPTSGTPKISASLEVGNRRPLLNDRAHQLDPVSAIISEEQGYVRLMARHYDEAIVICKKVLLENPTFARAHDCLAGAYWGKRGYPQVIEEWRAYGQLSGDRNDSAS